ncbi:HAMP domain-containing sensor histidine kinase [Neptuniibacter halophilus]|uniref:HAMP domain-containing sensor histidine kinase n=1 Tax=Neptuniibacter halophilus TaxID=651666 RepID=UPI002573F003|nr:ATP-binding protein [Neptuniibacter halophilus]
MSLRLKTIIGVAAIEAILLLLLVTMTLDYLRTTNYEGINKRAQTTATLFATTAKDAVLSYDLASLESFVQEVLKNPDLIYARVLGPQQQVFASAGDNAALNRPFIADGEVEAVHDGIFDTYAEIREGGVVYGRVELGLDIHLLRGTIEEAERRSVMIAALEMGLVALFSLILGTYLTRQLQVLTRAAKKISSGELDIQIPVKGRDEVADVAMAFNAMALNLKEASQRRDQYELALQELNRSLEDRVQKRTRQLEEKNHELERANAEIKNAQARLLQSEKMASIGVLAAGVAHEINNPLGFVMSNLATLDHYVVNYRTLIQEYETLSALESDEARQAQREKIALLRDEYDLEFMNEDLDELLKDTHEGSVRVREIVKGLKAFSHVDQSEERQWADINECIETTLKVANNELKYHCEVETDLGDIPQVNCMPGHIKQVILNMLLNAGHAIKERGLIRVETLQQGAHVAIRIRDNGCGIAEDEMSKLFDPFFTTKEVGEGTGLGLAISYGIIVEDHGGEIQVESQLGEGTCFTLLLPVEPQNQSEPLN